MHAIGSRIRFTELLSAPANDYRPACIYAHKGELGTIVGHGTSEGYWVRADGCSSEFGASESEFEIVNIPKPYLFNLDCRLIPAILDSNSVDLVFADPPFNIGFEYDEYNDKKSGNEYIAFAREWLAAVYTTLKPGGAFWLMSGDEFAAELKCLATNENGFVMRNWIKWHYEFGNHCTTKFSRCSCHIFHFVKPGVAVFNRETVLVPSKRATIYNDNRAAGGGKTMSDVWSDIPRLCGTFKERLGWHPCQLPEALLERIVSVSSNPGDTVLDPFAGSGTTLAVAQKLNRQSIGFELSAYYCHGIRERIGV